MVNGLASGVFFSLLSCFGFGSGAVFWFRFGVGLISSFGFQSWFLLWVSVPVHVLVSLQVSAVGFGFASGVDFAAGFGFRFLL